MKQIAVLLGCLLVGACASASMRAEELPVLGSSPLSYTVYIGSDDRLHYFVLQDGKSGREVTIRRQDASILPAAFDKASQRHGFVRSVRPGIIELTVLQVDAP